jgi:transposase
MSLSQTSSQTLDHLGIVAGMCQEIKLIERVDEKVKQTNRDVTVGQAVQAMVVNGLGFVGRPLYLTPEFFHNKPVDVLIGAGITADQLNEGSLGRALDHLYEAGVTEVFVYVAGHALREMGIATRFMHLDSTSFGLHGEYEFSAEDQAEMIEVTYGYSRDHRPDLKQVVLSLICTHQGAIPVWLEALSGNQADSTSFKQTVRTYIDQFGADGQMPYMVADTALYNAGTLEELGDEVKWITRVPASVSLCKVLYTTVELDDMNQLDDNYRVYQVGSLYGGVKQRWLLLYSESLYHRQVKTFYKQLTKQRREAEKQLRRVGRRAYPTPEAAQAALDAIADTWSFHHPVVSFSMVPHFNGRGRPAQSQSPDYYTWTLEGEVLDDDEAIAAALARKGRFILATNELDETLLSDEEIVTVYKGQAVTVERGFRFMKDPMLFADSFFLKKPSRIMALLMVMGLCLLIYALAEHLLRQQLLEHNETLPDQKGKPTQRITMRRVFQMFEGIHIVLIPLPNGIQRLVTNLTDVHRQILGLLGPSFEKYYFPDL